MSMEDLRLRPQRPSRNDSGINRLVSPRNNIPSRIPPLPSANDARSSLPRRFTTDSGPLPTLSPMPPLTSPPRIPDVPQDYNTLHRVQLIEKKKQEYERLKEQKRIFEYEMHKIDQQERREAKELAQLEEEMNRFTGHQSEPTTPPEYRTANPGSGFPTIFSQPNRYSTPTLTSPIGMFNRQGRSGSLLVSPPNGPVPQRYGFEENQMPSRSVPATRRNSDDDKEEAVRQDPTSHRVTNAKTIRYSMPVTHSKSGIYEPVNLPVNFDQSLTMDFLFDDEEPNTQTRTFAADEGFPTLVRHDDHGLSASSAALDLALSPSPNPESRPSLNNWRNSVNRHRTQQSMSAINNIFASQAGDGNGIANRPPAAFRHSLDLKYISEAVGETVGNAKSGQVAGPPKLQSSLSTNDIPTVKSAAVTSVMNGNANNHAQQHFHNHNASIGRIPAGAVPNRHNRELSNDASMNANREQTNAFSSINSALQSGGSAFGPGTPSGAPSGSALVTSSAATNPMSSFNNGFYPGNGYASATTPSANPSPGPYGGAHMYPGAASGMPPVNGGGGVNGGNGFSQNLMTFSGMPFNQANQAAQSHDSQARVVQHRRQADVEAMSRFHNMPLEAFTGQIYDLCKDQHGCRYLQKKLEERNRDQVHMIWLETHPHVIELMTDPFGNYLCQKLLEFCNDDERTTLITNAARDMVRIALNQHGTRALQKMIEHVNTPQQTQLIIEALRFRVVKLIQDLNGNHVIQKCLNKLSAADAQFIFDAVGNSCVEVGTHRHGCCVLQRCIDHATGEQKRWLIGKITEHARILVQDPFGNYVVQYIIDLNDLTFTEPIILMFKGCIGQLSRHKFSSNVIEKCLRCGETQAKDMIAGELLMPGEMERLLRDSYGNYVVQTAIEFTSPQYKHLLVEAIRPILPQIRNTPYGRRLQGKIGSHDNRGSAASSGQVTPADNTQGQIPLRPALARPINGGASLLQANLQANLQGQPMRPPFANGGPPMQQQAPFNPMMPGNFVQGHNVPNPNLNNVETPWV